MSILPLALPKKRKVALKKTSNRSKKDAQRVLRFFVSDYSLASGLFIQMEEEVKTHRFPNYMTNF